jgi:hypothetical protein
MLILWFAGTGLALVYLGLLNLITVQAGSRVALKACTAANVLGILFAALTLAVVAKPQAAIAVAAVLCMAVAVVLLAARSDRRLA